MKCTILFYAGLCPVCGEGTLDFQTCDVTKLLFLECKECDSLYKYPKDIHADDTSPPEDHKCPFCKKSLNGNYHSSTLNEIKSAGYESIITGKRKITLCSKR